MMPAVTPARLRLGTKTSDEIEPRTSKVYANCNIVAAILHLVNRKGQEPMTLGIIGVGTIAVAVVEGLQSASGRMFYPRSPLVSSK